MTADADPGGLRRAWGWHAHLRDGGATPWRVWEGAGEPGGRYLPGAQQLELLRRLNAAGDVPADLAARVLEASAPGRGRPDLELSGAVEPRAFGPAPIDPADLPDEELLRVLAGLLAEDVLAAGLPESPRPRAIRPWRQRYRMVGDPVLADPRREDLTARGRPPGGRGSVVLVLGSDLGEMLVHEWTARSLGYGAPPFREWVGRAVRDTVPQRVDLARTAAVWRERVGAPRVRIVLDLGAVPRLVRVRRAPAAALPLTADAIELARRVGQVLGLLVAPPVRRDLLRRTLVPRLATSPGPALVLPARHVERAHGQATRMRDALLRAGYAVHGDPDGLLPTERPGVPEPSDAGALALGMRLLLEQPEKRGTA
ncbi:hypothetical protein [Nocardioides sp. YIM 152315]|uniref:hypothetical protein n=1 Tax=Nocardioides sp. YIM 152315 TaxID=3031760 RepID=UPI0023DC324F|nr:hypothetical protein [Nocardioides sp. YIM 152315]MDF1604604.1 hypothetical protein [Nocardioides sp. YIM 152315]